MPPWRRVCDAGGEAHDGEVITMGEARRETGRTTTVAVLGTGLMGSAMARRMAGQGLDVHAWNRSADKLQALKPWGVTAAASVEEAADARRHMLDSPVSGSSEPAAHGRLTLIVSGGEDARGPFSTCSVHTPCTWARRDKPPG
ncbi:NAD(P)-binding domain-containing protein [Nonomuraea insulae]|uniref:NAD(P)-binding domain-containing protein n=1 Tax=Nonomuraea insulae TaxID=1616787 RepID=A0ABW1CNB6_9ACTN